METYVTKFQPHSVCLSAPLPCELAVGPPHLSPLGHEHSAGLMVDLVNLLLFKVLESLLMFKYVWLISVDTLSVQTNQDSVQ